MIKTYVFKKMHSRFLIFVWRKKLLLLATSLAFLVAIVWGFVYSAHSMHDDSGSGGSSRGLPVKFYSQQDLMGNSKFGMLQKLGINAREINSNEPIRFFFKPTPINIHTQHAPNRKENYFNDWNKILLDKDEKDRIENFAIISRDDIARRKVADEMKMAADKQAKYENQLKKMGLPMIVGLGPTNRHKPPEERIVHFDLKGAPLKVSYILKVLSMIKSIGATGIVLEYEDTFPYANILSPIAAKNAYSKKEIVEILQSAHSLGLNVIPLVQTFGHLEFALKVKEFKHLREVPDSPQSICPSLNSSLSFVEEMLTQVISLHTLSQEQQNIIMNRKSDSDDEAVRKIPKLTHIHIGCDEVYQLGECPRCRDKIHDVLFLDHVYNVASFIKKRWPEVNVIIWDDQIRQMSVDTLRASSISKVVEPMVWTYVEDIYKFVQSKTWDKYSQIFRSCWVAGAYKGAFGETLLIPPGRRHLENTLRWLAIIQGEGARFQEGIRGILLTGWSRYDHFATLCELLPAAIPSLAVCLHTASKGYFDIDSKTNSIIPALTCPEAPGDRYLWLDMQKDPNLAAFNRCIFPGSSVFRYINRLSVLTSDAREFVDSIKYSRGWLSDYNIRHNFTSPSRVGELLEDQPRILASFINLARSLAEAMEEMYDHNTIGEFIEQKIYPLVNELRNLEKVGESLKMRKVFPVRPLPYLEKFIKQLGITQKTPQK